jgi:hypothetical protein
VQWQTLNLCEKTGGAAYGATARPVNDKIHDLFSELKPSNQPTVVWMIDITDDKTNKRIEGTIFQNEDVGLAMKRFHCYKVDVRNLPEGDLKNEYLKNLGFYFFDPAGKPALRPLTGRRATSLSTFSGYLEKMWDSSYALSNKEFTKRMKDVLDAYDRAESKKQVLDKKKEKLKERPNARLQRAVDKEDAEVVEEMKAAEELEKQVIADCTLRPEFLPEASGDETGKKE